MGQDWDHKPDSSNDMFLPPRPRDTPPMGSIHVPFEIVVVCRGLMCCFIRAATA